MARLDGDEGRRDRDGGQPLGIMLKSVKCLVIALAQLPSLNRLMT
ncbi:hypothetical protein [Streptomyces sp. NPDC004721]